MYRTLQYALLFLVAALLQIFLFNNLSLSVYLNPLVYVVFIALLPMETTPIRMLLAGLAMGLAAACPRHGGWVKSPLRSTSP